MAEDEKQEEVTISSSRGPQGSANFYAGFGGTAADSQTLADYFAAQGAYESQLASVTISTSKPRPSAPPPPSSLSNIAPVPSVTSLAAAGLLPGYAGKPATKPAPRRRAPTRRTAPKPGRTRPTRPGTRPGRGPRIMPAPKLEPLPFVRLLGTRILPPVLAFAPMLIAGLGVADRYAQGIWDDRLALGADDDDDRDPIAEAADRRAGTPRNRRQPDPTSAPDLGLETVTIPGRRPGTSGVPSFGVAPAVPGLSVPQPFAPGVGAPVLAPIAGPVAVPRPVGRPVNAPSPTPYTSPRPFPLPLHQLPFPTAFPVPSPSPRPRPRPAPSPAPKPGPIASPLPLELGKLEPVPVLGPVPVAATSRDCPPPKKPQRKKRKPRGVCRRGTYIETSKSTLKTPKETIPCR